MSGSGLAQLFTCGGLGVWSLVDGILLLTGNDHTDEHGRILRARAEGAGPPGPLRGAPVLDGAPRSATPRRHPRRCSPQEPPVPCTSYRTDPHDPGHLLPQCPFRMLTGLLCPACGGTRMVYDLMHGHFTEAWPGQPGSAARRAVRPRVLLGRWAWEGLHGRRWRPTLSPRAQVVVLAVAVTWTVVRNLV